METKHFVKLSPYRLIPKVINYINIYKSKMIFTKIKIFRSIRKKKRENNYRVMPRWMAILNS